MINGKRQLLIVNCKLLISEYWTNGTIPWFRMEDIRANGRVLNNPDFKEVEFDLFKNEAGFNHFVLSPRKWISSTNAIGLQCRVKADKTQSNNH